MRHVHEETTNGCAWPAVLITALVLDTLALSAFLAVRGAADPLIVGVSLGAIALVYGFERFYLRRVRGNAHSASG